MPDRPDSKVPESSHNRPRTGPMDLPASLGHYTLFRKIGEGGAGSVYEGVDQKRSRRVAVKVLKWGKPHALYRFKREFRLLAGIAHPNLVSLYELVARGQRWFYSMELVDGADFVTAHRGSASRPIDWERLRESLRQIAAGLGEIHSSGKLHRDIKPSNVLVSEQGRVVILDFGLITQMSGESWSIFDPRNRVVRPASSRGTHETTDHGVLGTVGYMSPEQAAGDRLTPATDWYAVGSMLFETLTGRMPFEGFRLDVLLKKQEEAPPEPVTYNPDTPHDLNALCRRLLAIDPRNRPGRRELEELLGMRRSHAMPAQAASTPTGIPFVGRQQQLDELHGAFQRVLSGEAVTAYVHGVSGSGKSALVDQFLSQLRKQYECMVLTGRCFAEESVPFKSLDGLIDSLSRRLLRMDNFEVGGCIPQDVSALARLFPVLQRVSAVVEAPAPRGHVRNVQELRRRASTALRELLCRLSARRPLVLSIDDLQWGDADSVWLLSELLRPPDPPRLLLLLSYRSEEADSIESLQTFRETDQRLSGSSSLEIPLNELSQDESTELAAMLLGQHGEVRPELLSRIAQESGGNPYFVSELVRFVLSGHDLQTASGDEPVQLDEVFRHRISAYDEDQRRLLEIISIAGQPMELADAVDAAELRSDPQATVAQLRRDHLVRTSGTQDSDNVVIWHNRIREWVLRHMSDAERQDRHRRLARVLEVSGQTDPVQLAVHWRGAGEFEKAGEYFMHAADSASDALAFERAADWYRESLHLRKLDGVQEGVVRRRLAESLTNAGRREDAAVEYLAAAELLPNDEALDLRTRAATQFVLSGRLDKGRVALRDVVTAVGLRFPNSPFEAKASLIVQRARLRMRGLAFRKRESLVPMPHDLRKRIDITEVAAMGLSLIDPLLSGLFQARNLLFAFRGGDPVRVAQGLAGQAACSALSGRHSEKSTKRYLDAAGEVAEQSGHPKAIGAATLARGVADFLSGRYAAALEHCQLAEQKLRNHGSGVAWELDTAQIFGLWSGLYMGHLDQLRSRYHAVYQDALERGNRYLFTTVGAQVGTTLLLADGQTDVARERLNDLEAGWITDRFTVQHHNILLARARLDVHQGEPAAALNRLQHAIRSYRQSGLLRVQHIRIDLEQMTGRCALGVLARGNEQSSAAEQTARRSIRQLQRERMGYADALALFLNAGLSDCLGRESEASDEYERAAAELKRFDHSLFSRVAWDCCALISNDSRRDKGDDNLVVPRQLRRCVAPWRQDRPAD